MATYSFLDVYASIVGPNGSIPLGSGSGNAEEGITLEPVADIDTLTIGADGTPMHSLVANKAAHVIVRLLKTSPINAALQTMLSLDRLSGTVFGRNTIKITQTATGDNSTQQFCAFAKVPTITYAKDGGMNEWRFNCGICDLTLGALA